MPGKMKKRPTLRKQLIDRARSPEANEQGECWVWDRALDNHGYGRVKDPDTGRANLIHRVSIEANRGEPIPDGLVVDHICRNRACYRPSHLRLVTNRDNLLAPGSQAPPATRGKWTHCPRGHEFSDENTYITPRGYRQCRTCVREGRKKRGKSNPREEGDY